MRPIIGIDWGSSNFRLWMLDEEGKVLAERKSPDGTAFVPPGGYRQILEGHLRFLPFESEMPIFICGMAGSRQGWQEVPYRDMGENIRELCHKSLALREAGLDIRILPGLAKRDPASPDVMRGEETKLLGACLLENLHSGFFCLPGTHSKWIRLEEDHIRDFSTSMTGELFSLLKAHSILRFLNDPILSKANPALDEPSFLEGAAEGLKQGHRLSSLLFQLRARSLLYPKKAGHSFDRLSGLLIGAEIAACKAEEDQTVTIIGTASLAYRYQLALSLAHYSSHFIEGEAAVRRGLLFAAQNSKRKVSLKHLSA